MTKNNLLKSMTNCTNVPNDILSKAKFGDHLNSISDKKKPQNIRILFSCPPVLLDFKVVNMSSLPTPPKCKDLQKYSPGPCTKEDITL